MADIKNPQFTLTEIYGTIYARYKSFRSAAVYSVAFIGKYIDNICIEILYGGDKL